MYQDITQSISVINFNDSKSTMSILTCAVNNELKFESI